jgi:hypothetical protein
LDEEMEKKTKIKKIHVGRRHSSEVLKRRTPFRVIPFNAFNKKADQGKVPNMTTGT